MTHTMKDLVKTLSFVFLVCFLWFLFVHFYTSPAKTIMSYYVPEKMGEIPANKTKLNDQINNLTVIAYAFLHVHPNGKILFDESDLSSSVKNNHFCQKKPVICHLSQESTTPMGHFDFFSTLNNKNTIVSLPRYKFWDIQVPRIHSPTRQACLRRPGRPASAH